MGICQGPECDRETELVLTAPAFRRCASCRLLMLEEKFVPGRKSCIECARRFKAYTTGPGAKEIRARQAARGRARMDAEPKRQRTMKLLSVARSRARKKGIEFAVSAEDLVPLPDICPCLGLELNWRNSRGVSDPAAPTLDRLDNARGYVPGNVWVISMKANRIKSDSSVAELRAVAQAVARRLGDG